METYLRVTFDSEGARPSEIADRLRSFGFLPTQGNYDFVYDWKGAATREQLVRFHGERYVPYAWSEHNGHYQLNPGPWEHSDHGS